uniref:Uncharacterized protein n=1 Tax=Arundo donax TaxID=35708 RepID=A0A0A9EKN3_ARUDO
MGKVLHFEKAVFTTIQCQANKPFLSCSAINECLGYCRVSADEHLIHKY